MTAKVRYSFWKRADKVYDRMSVQDGSTLLCIFLMNDVTIKRYLLEKGCSGSLRTKAMSLCILLSNNRTTQLIILHLNGNEKR